MISKQPTRMRVLTIIILVFALLLITKLFFVQVLHGSSYKEQADKQYVTPSSNIFKRGSIFLKDKSGDLITGAGTISGFKVAINPGKINNIEDTYNSIVEIIPIDHESFLVKAEKKDDPYEEIANKIHKKEADLLRKLNLPGVDIHKERWRFYPGGNLASHVLGLIAFKENDLIGHYGIERYYEDVLSQEEDDLYINFFAEVFSNIGKTVNRLVDKEDQRKGDVITSIEPTVQVFLEDKLKAIMDDWRADSTGGIIINPQTGEIYAMAAFPNFDLNDFSKVDDPSLFSNPIVENVFELGSIIKPLVMAAGLDTGAITSETTYYDGGKIVVENKTIHNFDKKGRGTVNMQEVLNQSLNTGMVFVMQQVGKDKLKEYLISYGIGEKTGIDLPNETSGLISNLESKREIEYATVAFGQGIAITPIEAVRAFSILANGGTKITPHLVKEIKYEKGGGKEIKYPPSDEQIIKKDTSKEITRMLVEIVDTALFNGKEKMEHYSIAAKTGTAQIANKSGGGYYEDRYLHSFFGYFPAYDPDFLVLLYAIDPKGVRYSSQTLAPPFMETAKFLLNYYEIP